MISMAQPRLRIWGSGVRISSGAPPSIYNICIFSRRSPECFHGDFPRKQYGSIGIRKLDERPVHRVPKRRIARSERTSRRTFRRTATSARPPEPTSATPAERFQCAVGIKNFDRGAGLWVDVVERFMAWALGAGRRGHHAALSVGSARARPRR
jgi:hypothetical protein